MTEDSALVRFYRGTGADHAGRTIAQILAWPDDTLENTHDYIQWLFPLPEASTFNLAAPLLTDADRRGYEQGAALRENLARAFARMLRFYGLKARSSSGEVTVRPSADFARRSSEWLTRGNHNFLRLTRIVRSMHLLGLTAHARALQVFLAELARRHAGIVGETTACYWRDANSG